MPALQLAFFLQAGIASAGQLALYGDGEDIQIEQTNDRDFLVTYQLKFGSCKQACTKVHEWKFRVDAAGEVFYLGSSGHLIPPWINPPKYRRFYPQDLPRH
jgi:hypothetical protein